MTFGLTPVTPETNEDFALTAGTGFPVAGSSTFPRYWQIQSGGTDLGNRAATTLNFVDGDGGTFTGTRGAGEQSGVITITFTATSGPEPGFTDLFYARFEAVSYSDEVGNWIFVQGEWTGPADTFIIDTTDGAPGSTAGSMNNDEGGSLFVIGAAADRTGSVTQWFDRSDVNNWDWIYSVWFQPAGTNIDLGKFDQAGNILRAGYYNTVPPNVEVIIEHSAGSFALFGEPTITQGEWHELIVRRTGDLYELLLDGVVLESNTLATTQNAGNILDFRISKENSGRWDEPRFQYRVRS